MEQAVCGVSGLKLWARVNAAGYVTGVSNNDPVADRDLPLFGRIPDYDTVTEVLSVASYQVAADRVTRTYSVRPKTAAELLKEICWWFAAVHADRHASPDEAAQ